MFEKIKYINHINESIESGMDGIYINENDLRDFSWDVQTKNDKISGFKKGIVTKTVPFVIVCENEDVVEKKDRLFEIFEKDVLAKKHGKLIVGDYYLKCYVTANKKANYLLDKGYIETTLTITTDYPFWIKETETEFNMSKQQNIEYLDYTYDFLYDFMSEATNGVLNNTGFVDVNFRINIFGFVTNPTIYINGHEYSVNVTVSTGEYLTIDSVEKTIILTRYNGEKVNCFNERNKKSYIFEKISTGTNIVTCDGQLLFTVTLIEERSEPKWI